MKIRLKEAADFVGGVVIGNPEVEINGLAEIEEASKGDLTFLYLPINALGSTCALESIPFNEIFGLRNLIIIF